MNTDVYKMDLSRPIEAHGETTSELTLRDPESDALDGIDISIGPKGLTFDLGAMPRIVAAAAGIPPSSARKIPLRDMLRHTVPIISFFGLDIQATGGTSE